MAGALPELDQGNFESTLSSEKKTIVAQFYTDTCTTCHALERVSVELAGKHNSALAFYKVNAGTSPELAIKYKVLNVPAFKFFKGGKLIGDLVGSVDEKKLRNAINDLLTK